MWRTSRDQPEVAEVDHSPRALVLLYRLLSLDEVGRVREAIAEGVEWLAGADAVSLWESTGHAIAQTARRGGTLDPRAAELERRLVNLRGPARSTLERHTEPDLQRLSERYREQGRLCQVRPLRAFGERIGSIAFHCFGRAQVSHGEMQALRQFSDAAGVALRSAYGREELRRLAYTDPLTGLANRRRIDQVIDEASGQPLAVLFVDFDGLKAVNDFVSYEAGDAVIEAVGEALRALTTRDRVPGRLGGDEFVVVLLGVDEDRARAEAENLAAALESITVPKEAERYFRGASVGWATAEPTDDSGLLLRRAASDMKAAKRQRRLDHEQAPDT